jgi:hypothetical protein
MSEDPKRAKQMVDEEIRDVMRRSQQVAGSGNVAAICYQDMSDWPDGDGDGILIPVVIGVRGNLTKKEAQQCAAMWHEVTRHYPKAGFQISLLGYNEDPREIWEISEAARYVRWWARFAGMNDPEVANRYLGTGSPMFGDMPELAGIAMGFLAGCGAFGEAAKQMALRNCRPTPKH